MTCWNKSAICFVRLLDSLFCAIEVASVLSFSMSVVGMSESYSHCWRCTNSNVNLDNQVISLTHEERATYSASPDERAATNWSFHFQDMGEPLI